MLKVSRIQKIDQFRKRKERQREMEQRHKEFADFVRKLRLRKKHERVDRDTREHTGTDDE